MDALSFDFDGHRTGGDEFGRAVRVRRNQPTASSLAGNVTHAFERRASDCYFVAFDIDSGRVTLGRVSRLCNVWQRCRHEWSRRTRHLTDIGQRRLRDTVAARGDGRFRRMDTDASHCNTVLLNFAEDVEHNGT